MSDYEISLSASEIHEYALGKIRETLKMPKGVRYPDGFVAGRGEWATKDRPIFGLVQFPKDAMKFPVEYRFYMANNWGEAGYYILMDYRYVDWNSYLDPRVFEYKHPGLIEGSGAEFCFVQENMWSRSISPEDEPVYKKGMTYDFYKAMCESGGFVIDRSMFDFISKMDQLKSYPQRSVAKNFHDARGRVNKAGPWSWMDFERYCEEITFGTGNTFGGKDPFRIHFTICEFLRFGPGSSWEKGGHAGQITRILCETTDMSPVNVSEITAAKVMALAAMLSISRGGDREMYRKMDAYFSGKTPYRSNGRRGRRW